MVRFWSILVLFVKWQHCKWSPGKRDLKETWLVPHCESAFLKLHGPEIEKLQGNEDPDKFVAEYQDQHKDEDEVVV